MPRIITTGELLIDFTPVRAPGFEGAVYPNPGGAPANVAAQLTKLGVSAGFIGKVGNDGFGRDLRKCLDEHGVDTHGLKEDGYYRTTLAFVHLSETGDRSFTFYRDPGADTQLRPEEVDMAALEDCQILHFGSLSLTTEPGKTATLEMVRRARELGKLISYDPNWRPPLWESQEAGIEGMSLGLDLCHLMKVSEEELRLLAGTGSIVDGVQALHSRGIQLIMVTMGPDGCVSSFGGQLNHHATFDIKVADTTGSGDSFWGAFLSQLALNGYDTPQRLAQLSQDELSEFCRFANAAGSICATRMGGIPALPDREEILRCMKERGTLETGFKLW